MINNKNYITWFNFNGTIPDEHCYITNIFINNLENEIITTLNIAAGATTFINWEGMDYKYVSTKNLKEYSEITEEELLYLLNSNSLFGRKFNRKCIISFINNIYIDFITSK